MNVWAQFNENDTQELCSPKGHPFGVLFIWGIHTKSAQNSEAEKRKNPPKSRFSAKKPQKQHKFNRKSPLSDHQVVKSLIENHKCQNEKLINFMNGFKSSYVP